MSTKQDVLVALYNRCKQRDNFVFTNNDDVKPICEQLGFKNPFDATKIDSSRILPHVLRQNDVFVIHLGQGRHRFVNGIASGYHDFEAIPQNQRIQWRYRSSVLNNVNTSESNILSMANNQRIIHDFLYEDIAASPKAYGSNRTHIPISYQIGTVPIEISRVQVEIDFTLEYQGVVTSFEAKNGDPPDFNVFQLFHPYNYYLKAKADHALAIQTIQCCYLTRQSNRLRLYLYTFEDPDNPGSIRLERNAEYTLVPR